MQKMTFFSASVSILAMLTIPAGAALSQSTAAPAQSMPAAHAHQQGMDHGGQQMHDEMMQDHQSSAQQQQQAQPNQQGMPGMSGMSGMSKGAGMPPRAKAKKSVRRKPATRPMPKAPAMPADKPMSDM